MQEENPTIVLGKIEEFLQQDARNQICVFNDETNKKLDSKVSYSGILETGATNLPDYLLQFGLKYPEIKKVRVEKYTPNGTTTIKVPNGTLKVKLALGDVSPDESAVAVSVTAPSGTNYQKPSETMNHQDQNTFPVGMNAAVMQHIELVTRAKEATRLEKENEKLEKKIENLEKKNDLLNDKLRKSKVDLDTADKFKELELLKASLAKKPFIDKETGQMLSGAILPIMEKIMSGGGSGAVQQQAVGLQGVENLSDVKKGLIQEIAKQDFTDQMANNLTNIYILLDENNPVINQQFETIINQYNNN